MVKLERRRDEAETQGCIGNLTSGAGKVNLFPPHHLLAFHPGQRDRKSLPAGSLEAACSTTLVLGS